MPSNFPSKVLLIVLTFDFSSQILNFFAFSGRVRSKMCRNAMILHSKVTLMFMRMFQTLTRRKIDFFVLVSIGNQHCSQKSTQKGKNNGAENRDFGRFLKQQF